MKKIFNDINSLEKDEQSWQEEIKNVKRISSKVFNKKKPIKHDTSVKPPQSVHKTQNKTLVNDLRKIKRADNAGIDYKRIKKMDAGDYALDAIIDLHGFTIDQAFKAFCNFTENSFIQGHRMLLVITGKGLKADIGVPTINKMLQEWVNEPMVKSRILRYNYATSKHGGRGAYYILLKKNK